MEQYAKKLHELYVNYEKNFIQQFDDGSYRSFIEKHLYLGVGFIKHHIEGSKTYGIREKVASKVIVFDVDEMRKDIVDEIVAILEEFGFPQNTIHVSFSGKKGYHITAFFSEPISLKLLKVIHYGVLVKLYKRIPNAQHVNIDLRPTKNYGVKIPLGIHRSTGNRCWFVKKSTLAPIEDFEYIYTIERISLDFFLNEIMERLKKENSQTKLIQDALLLSQRDEIKYKSTSKSDKDIEAILQIELLPGMRHNTLYHMCILLKLTGLSAEECKQELNNWIYSQDKNLFTTPLYKCEKDIEEIVNNVYKRCGSENNTTAEKTIINLHCSQLRFILSFKSSKMWLLLLYLLKYYHSTASCSLEWQGHALSSIQKETGLAQNTITKLLHELKELGYIHTNTYNMSDELFTNHIEQEFWYRRFGKGATEIQIDESLIIKIEKFPDMQTCYKFDNLISLEDNLKAAVEFFGLREELYLTLSRRAFEKIFGNYKRAA